ncbi:MAG: SDR family oxidoreductase [Phycisphaerae bacterium]
MEPTNDGSLAGRSALVCGGSQGIGRACAVRLAQLGATVTVVARDHAALTRVRDALPSDERQRHQVLVADFTRPEVLAEKIAAHLEQAGPIQILLNNTGGPPHGLLVEADPQAFVQAITMHVVCNQILLQTLLPGMKAAGYGRIINIISTSVKEPIPGLGISNTTRWAVAAWAKTLSRELAPLGITVNNVLPGYTDTARLDALFEAKSKAEGVPKEAVKRASIEKIPAGRLAAPEEIAAAVGFLASPAAAYINGINLPVDGGRLASL